MGTWIASRNEPDIGQARHPNEANSPRSVREQFVLRRGGRDVWRLTKPKLRGLGKL
jgi:hypothetical protein